jgi:ribosomal protein L40E
VVLNCGQCGAEGIAADALFCPRCGNSLGRVCDACGADAPPDAEFCIKCGSRLVGEEKSEATAQPAGERRQITAMFCDMVGSTELAQRLDPEEMQQVVQGFRNRCSEAVAR